MNGIKRLQCLLDGKNGGHQGSEQAYVQISVELGDTRYVEVLNRPLQDVLPLLEVVQQEINSSRNKPAATPATVTQLPTGAVPTGLPAGMLSHPIPTQPQQQHQQQPTHHQQSSPSQTKAWTPTETSSAAATTTTGSSPSPSADDNDKEKERSGPPVFRADIEDDDPNATVPAGTHVFGVSFKSVLLREQCRQRTLQFAEGGNATSGPASSVDPGWTWHSGLLPAFLRHAYEYILKHGLQSEGLFRISGSSDTLANLRRALEEGNDNPFEEQSGGDTGKHATAVADLVGFYFRELPFPLIPSRLFRPFLSLSDLKDTEKLSLASMLFQRMPQEHLAGLLSLMHIMWIVSRNKPSNMMGPDNLAVCFGMNILREQEPAEAEATLEAMKRLQAENNKVVSVVTFLISAYPTLQTYATTSKLIPSKNPHLEAILTGKGPSATAVGHDTRGGKRGRIWISDADGEIRGYNGETMEQEASGQLNGTAVAILPLFAPATGLVVATSSGVFLLDMDKLNIRKSIERGCVAAILVGSAIWCVGIDSLFVINLNSFEVERELELRQGASALLCAAENNEVWVAVPTGQIAIFDVTTCTRTHSVEVSKYYSITSLTCTEQSAWCALENGSIALVDFNTREVTQELKREHQGRINQMVEAELIWSCGQDRKLVTFQAQRKVRHVEIPSFCVEPIKCMAASPQSASWRCVCLGCGDGSLIVYSVGKGMKPRGFLGSARAPKAEKLAPPSNAPPPVAPRRGGSDDNTPVTPNNGSPGTPSKLPVKPPTPTVGEAGAKPPPPKAPAGLALNVDEVGADPDSEEPEEVQMTPRAKAALAAILHDPAQPANSSPQRYSVSPSTSPRTSEQFASPRRVPAGTTSNFTVKRAAPPPRRATGTPVTGSPQQTPPHQQPPPSAATSNTPISFPSRPTPPKRPVAGAKDPRRNTTGPQQLAQRTNSTPVQRQMTPAQERAAAAARRRPPIRKPGQ